MNKSMAAVEFDLECKLLQKYTEELLGIADSFEDLARDASTDDVTTGKLHRAIEGMREYPRSFLFLKLDSPDLAPPPGMMSEDGMDGRDWPEALRPRIWEVQRILIRRYKSRERLLKHFRDLLPIEQSQRSLLLD